MRYTLIRAAASMALLGAATLASAQTQDDKGTGPSSDGKGPAASQPQADPKSRPQAEPKSQPRAGAESGKDKSKAAQQQPSTTPKSTDGQQKATQERTTDRPKSAQQQERSKDGAKRTENLDDKKAAEQQPDRGQDRTKTTETPQRDSDRQKSAGGRDEPSRDRSKSADRPKQGERVKVTEKQRTTVRERLSTTRVERTRVNVSVNIGATVPRSVRLHVLPAAIIEIVPEYRSYRYIVLEDGTILIVHPTTYVVVDYIPAGSSRG